MCQSQQKARNRRYATVCHIPAEQRWPAKVAALIPARRQPPAFSCPSGHHFRTAICFSCQSGGGGARVGRDWGESLRGPTRNLKGFDPRVGRVWGETLKGLARKSGWRRGRWRYARILRASHFPRTPLPHGNGGGRRNRSFVRVARPTRRCASVAETVTDDLPLGSPSRPSRNISGRRSRP